MLSSVEISDEESARRAERFPVGASMAFDDFDLAGREERLDSLRTAEPLSWLPALQMWMATGYDVARDVLGSEATTVEADANLVRESLGPMMLTTDGSEHKRLRAPFDPAFRLRHVLARFTEVIDEEVERHLDPLRTLGECEMASAFAAPYSVGMAGRMLGITLDQAERINEFYEAFAGAMVYDGNPEPQRRADAARSELNEILREQVGRCRRDGGESITSIVVNADDPTVTDDEVIAQLRVIMFGAIETIQSAILNTIFLLHRNPDQLDLVHADPALVDGACEEAMRLIPPVSFIERWVARPFRHGEIELGVGEFVGVSALAANRDPAQFPDPLRYDVQRPNSSRSFAFSHGAHHCIGLRLARIEIAAAVRAWLALPGVTVAHADEPAGFVFRRPASLTVRWAPDAGVSGRSSSS